MFNYEEISNINKNNVAVKANKILTEGWERRGYPSVDLSSEIPWLMERKEYRSWNFYIHCWDMLDSLLFTFSESNDRVYFDPAYKVALDWVKRYGLSSSESNDAGEDTMAWYDMAVGVRSYRLAYIYDVATRLNVGSEDDRQLMWDSLECHREYLAEDSNIKFHNNHGFYQVAGQLAMGRRFRTVSKKMDATYLQGEQRLFRMINQQFSSDGVHKEHSPDYHRMVYETLRALITSGLLVRDDMLELADRIEEALSWFVLPNGYIANFGDSDYRLMSRKPKAAIAKWQNPAMQHAVTQGEVGERPNEEWKLFEEGGYFVGRCSTESPGESAQYSYLAQQGGFHSRTHKHADDLSFIWFDRGRDLLVDSGRYGYLGKVGAGSRLSKEGFWYSDPNRIYCEKTKAHNCLEFDGRDFPRRGAKAYGNAIKRVRKNDGVIAIESEIRPFKGVRYNRVLFLCPGHWLLVLDWFKDAFGLKHDVKQWFHLAPDLKAQLGLNDYIAQLPKSGESLRVIPLFENMQASQLYLGEDSPDMQGWWSPKEREILPNYAFNFSLAGPSHGALATLFSFSESLAPVFDRTIINASGRKGRFSWLNNGEKEELSFERPEVGAMKISYEGEPRNFRVRVHDFGRR